MKKLALLLSLIYISATNLFSQPVIKVKDFGEFNEGLLSVLIGDKWGFIDTNGVMVIQPKYQSMMGAPYFSNGVAVVELEKAGPFGAIDKTDKTVVPFAFYRMSRFGDDVAVTMKPADAGNGGTRAHCQVVSKNGTIVNDSTINEYNFNTFYSEGLSHFREKSKYGFLDKNGMEYIDNIYGDIAPFSEGLAAVYHEGKWIFIDKSNKQVPGFSSKNQPGDFKNGRSIIFENNKRGAIDKSGKIVVDLKYEALSTFDGGFAVGKYSDEKTWETVFEIIDLNGKVIKKFAPSIDKGKYFFMLTGFSEGLAVIREGYEKSGFIDSKGKMVIDFKFNQLEKFKDGRAYAVYTDPKTQEEKAGFIDKKGKFVFYLKKD